MPITLPNLAARAAAAAVVSTGAFAVAMLLSGRSIPIREYTAAALVCAGLALFACGSRRFGTAGILLSGIVVAIGVSAFVQVWRSGMTGMQILPLANLAVVLAGAAGILHRSKSGLASALAAAVAFVGIFGMVSVLYGASLRVGGTPVPPMTLLTAILFTLWAIGFLIQHASGPVGVVLKRDRWGKSARQVAVMVTVVPVAFGVLCSLAIQRGHFDSGLALAMLATGTSMTLAATVVWVAARMRDEDLRSEQIASERRQAEALYKTIVETSQEGIYVVDASGRISFANERLAEMIGCTPAELIGAPMHQLLVEEQRADAEQRLARRHAGQGASREDVQMLRRDGQIIDAVKSSSALFDADGRLTGVVAMVSDVTDRVAAQRALENAYDVLRARVAELEESEHQEQPDTPAPDVETTRRGVVDLAKLLTAANAELETFSYSVSHDLRAPLRGIDGFSRELERDYGETLDDRGRHYLTRIRVATSRMSRLIDDLLDLARLSRKSMNRTTVNVSELAASVGGEVRDRAAGRTIDLRVEPGITADGDPHLLRIVFENLLGNAVKFTSRRPDAVIEVGTSDGAIFVRDNGVGFDVAHAGKLFAPFQRLHTSEFEGTGIGLAIVQRIVHRHGGTIRAEALPGHGATFTFTLGEIERKAA